MNNSKLGKSTENEFSNLVKDQFNGVTIKFPRSIYGQPFDMMAVFNNKVWFIDIKHCEGSRFSFSNIQANQKLSFELLEQKRGNAEYETGFMIYFNDLKKFKFMRYSDLKKLEQNGKRSILYDDSKLKVIKWNG